MLKTPSTNNSWLLITFAIVFSVSSIVVSQPGKALPSSESFRGSFMPIQDKARVRAPEIKRRPRLAQHRQAAFARGAQRQSCAAGFLDLRLHQLHAHHSGPQTAGAQVPESTGSDRRALGQVRKRERDGKYSAHHPALRDRASRFTTTRSLPSGAAMPSTPGPRRF